jgi:DNA-binding response OmpR family regulator
VIAHERSKRSPVPSVLVVEPYADLRAGIVSTLQRRDYVCDAVETPDAAALMLREHDYAYIVVDVDVPEPVNELVSKLGEESNVILITDDVRRDAQESRHPMLRKPFSREELLAQFRRR